MSANPAPIARLVSELGKLPGIGQRTAQRLAFHILRQSPEDANALADAGQLAELCDEPLYGSGIQPFA